jgi:hypothetical protein
MSAKRVSRPDSRGSASHGFEQELAELEALKAAPIDDAARDRLRKALAHRNNYVVSKAAKIVEENALAALLPEVLAAYDRFFIDAVKTDPQCWAKNALVKAMVALEHRDKDAYLRGLRHHQMEPTWGGQSDTAGTLRGACAHALANCPGISDADLLALLLELFADADKAVRVEAARAIVNVGGHGAVLLLRMRALLGKGEEPEVLGACYSGLLSLEKDRAIAFVTRFLEGDDDAAGEAAFALAETRAAEALAALIARHRAGAEPWLDGVLLSAIALCRLPEAIEYLIGIVESDEFRSASAIEAIGRTAPSAETRARVEQAVAKTGSRRLEQALRQHLP